MTRGDRAEGGSRSPPPARRLLEPGVVAGDWWHPLEDGRLQCDLCPRGCKLREGQRGFCFVRQARDGGIALTSYGRNTGTAVDPIEKKPLYHFYPGSTVLSFGTAGCNLGCRYCQNWHMSKARELRRMSTDDMPSTLARRAQQWGCRGLAFTYNDPVIFAEYAIDAARAAHEIGLVTVAVTAGYVSAEARPAFFGAMDGANVDLKAFSDDFYRELCYGRLDPVLETLIWLKNESEVWFEITTLLIPGHNDGEREIERECDWILENLGPDVPLHFTAFHPDFRMRDVRVTPLATLRRARQQALRAGLNHVYTGNTFDPAGSSTQCAGCGATLIGRLSYQIREWNLAEGGSCPECGERLPGRLEDG